jgi:hypothetical protein
MASSSQALVRDAEHDDIAAVCRFGEAHIPAHYAPLIGTAAADEQVRRWWNETAVGAAGAPTMWSTSSLSTPSIAAVDWAEAPCRHHHAAARRC